MAYPIIEYDPALKDFEGDIRLRMETYDRTRKGLLGGLSVADFANAHMYYGLHLCDDGTMVVREWLPGADEVHLTGDFNGWDRFSHPMKKHEDGVFDITLSKEEAMHDGDHYKILVTRAGRTEEHIPAYATYVVQDPSSYVWSACYLEEKDFPWTDQDRSFSETPLIYECHIGMAQEREGTGTYTEFKENVLPRIIRDGYNTIQIMAVMEHPYYASFGYQVSSFFAPSSRFGKPDDLRDLINEAHKHHIRVLLDVVHSHACANTSEGLNHLDGTDGQYFLEGVAGWHPAWGTRLFNYGKYEVLHFLLSNLKYWMESFHFDGFRFDGVTSMLYHDHGLGTAFMGYKQYFSLNTDMEALVYLMLANDLIHEVDPNALSVAEDMSGYPGMCLPVSDGGVGFDYRLAMGIPDLWIRNLKEKKDEDWDLGRIHYDLITRRPHEKVIAYAESHDQALVGDKTIMFRLCDKEMYTEMDRACQSAVIDRGMALHKMIRFITLTLGGEGYLNFMGNEFGHPEWIDFPREGNGWSHYYCRRQWSLCDNGFLRYSFLNAFDNAMLKLAKKHRVLQAREQFLLLQEEDKILAFQKGSLVFVFNFHPTRSFAGYYVPVNRDGDYKAVFTSDDPAFGGFGRIDPDQVYHAAKEKGGAKGFLAYLPSRTVTVFRRIG